MARQSRWQQFTNNFNSVYDTFTNAGKDFETAKVARQEFTDEDGVGLTGDALDRARNSALADIYTKYGDPEGGLALRTQGAALEGVEFGNRLNRNTEADQTYQMGLGNTRNLDARTSSANAAAAQAYANAETTTQMRPGAVLGQDLDNEGTGLLNRSRAVDASIAERTINDEVAQAQAEARNSVLTADENEATSGTRVDAANSTSELEAATANAELLVLPQATITKLAELQDALGRAETNVADREANARDKTIMEDILDSMLEQPEFENDAAASAWIIDEITNSDMTLGGQNSFAQTIGQRGVMQLGSQAAARTQSLVEARNAGGIDAMADAYEKFQDGVDGRIVRDDKGNVSVVMFDTETGEEMATIATASGPDAEDILAERLMAYAGDRIGMMQLAAAEASQADLRAQTGQRDADAEATLAAARADMLGASGGVDVEHAMKAITTLMTSANFQDSIRPDATDEEREGAYMAIAETSNALVPGSVPFTHPEFNATAWYNSNAEQREELRRLYSQ